MKRGLFYAALLICGAVSIDASDALAGHCHRGTNAAKIRCLNSEVAYLTTKWKEVLGEIAKLKAPGAVLSAFPKGTVLNWYRPDGAPMPDGWAPCDGTEGQPNLMGQFLRGGTKIGEPGGRPSHTHKVANDGDRSPHGFQVDEKEMALGNADEQSHLPPYVTVAFICKK